MERYLDIDDERVVTLCWQRGVGTGSEVPVEMDFAQVFTVKGGAITRIDVYSERAEALEAVGLSE